MRHVNHAPPSYNYNMYPQYMYTIHAYMQVTSSTTRPHSGIWHQYDYSSDEESSISAPPYSPFSLSSSDEMPYNSSLCLEDQERSKDLRMNMMVMNY